MRKVLWGLIIFLCFVVVGGLANYLGRSAPAAAPAPAERKLDPPGLIDPRNARLKRGGWWDRFFTRYLEKLTDDADGNGINREHNATFRALAAIAGVDDPDAFLDKGYLHFRVKINAAGLVPEGGGKHLVNVMTDPGALGRRERRGTSTRLEIANPGGRGQDSSPRLVLHNYSYTDGERKGGATDLGRLPWRFEPDKWVEVDWHWERVGRTLHIEVNGRKYEAELLEGSQGPGRYWGSGHMETTAGGGEFTFAELEVSDEPIRRPAPGR
ncbi:MAG TPA: hypothetical protein VMZ92_07235 [Planctomycetota bacterium]|nr:hypothetical protein [Planctomycetota bacterium]